MVIRPEQMDVLSDYMLRSFVDRMVVYIRSRFAKQTAGVSDEQLRGTIQAGIDSAETHGITDEADVQRYLDYVIGYGAEFDSTEWAAPILNQKASGPAKMNDLDDYNICRHSGGGQ